MNDDLISRSAFLKRMIRTARYFDIKFDIMEEPAVDAVIPVRCKDCKHFKMGKYCILDCSDAIREPTDFCSYGERRDDHE